MVVDKITATLPFIFINPEVIVYKVSSTQVFYKLLVVCDNHKLKVPLLLSSSDNSAKKVNNFTSSGKEYLAQLCTLRTQNEK